MVRGVIGFVFVITTIFGLFGCSKPPILACGTDEESRQLQTELETRTEANQLWDAISAVSKNCTIKTPEQKKIVQDAVSKWVKVTSITEQRASYVTLPKEATETRLAILNSTDTLGLLKEKNESSERLVESDRGAVGTIGKKLSLTPSEITRLTSKHKWIDSILLASEFDGYHIYLTRTVESYGDNPDKILVETPTGGSYEIEIMTEMYAQDDSDPLYQVVRLGKEGQQALMVKQLMAGAHGSDEDIRFFLLSTGKIIPRHDSNDGNHAFSLSSSSASAGTGVSDYSLHFLKDANGSLVYAVGIGEEQPGESSDGKGCTTFRNYFSFNSAAFGKIKELSESENIDCAKLAEGYPRPSLNVSELQGKLAGKQDVAHLGKIINLDRRDASDERVLQEIKSKAPSKLVALTSTVKLGPLPEQKSFVDVVGSVRNVEHSIDSLHWLFNGTPYSHQVDATFQETKRKIAEVNADIQKLNIDQAELTAVEDIRKEIILAPFMVVAELSSVVDQNGVKWNAYDVVRTNKNERSLLWADEDLFSWKGQIKWVLAREEDIVDVKISGFSTQVPKYSTATKDEMELLKKYEKNKYQISQIKAKAAGIYQEVGSSIGGLPGLLSNRHMN